MGIAEYKIYRDGTLTDSTSARFFVDHELDPEEEYIYSLKTKDMAEFVSEMSFQVTGKTILPAAISDSAFRLSDG
ncbi:MAG: hypothetical protein JRJ62_03720 [Deltaproteobacteria bacterium]|nr:hypothetical protein [Deltaproteobacteria bacterium]